MDDRSFLEAIQANPDNEVTRLVYADWLDERGDPRGELIRVQCDLARFPASDPRRNALNERESELLEDYGESWLEPLRELGALGVSIRFFQRGLLEHLKISAEDFLKHADTLCDLEPALSRVQLTNIGPHFKQLSAARWPAQITSLDLSTNTIAADDFSRLAKSSLTGQLKALNLKFTRMGNDELERLCSGQWPRLECLDLSANRIGPEGASALAVQSCFPQLKVLLLSMNPIGETAASFFEGHSLDNLRELHLASNWIPDPFVKLMIARNGLPALQILNLRYNLIQGDMQKQLQASPLGQRLQNLDLTGNPEDLHS